MKRKINMLICIIAGMAFIIGCGTTRLEMDYGTSYQLQKYNQILNANAEQNLGPAIGLNGKAAQNAVEKYQKSFEKTSETSTTYQFSIGSIGNK